MVPLVQPIILSVRNLRLSTSSPQFGRRVAARAMLDYLLDPTKKYIVSQGNLY